MRVIIVEVRRDLYMDENSGARLPRFDEVWERILGALGVIAAADASRGHGG